MNRYSITRTTAMSGSRSSRSGAPRCSWSLNCPGGRLGWGGLTHGWPPVVFEGVLSHTGAAPRTWVHCKRPAHFARYASYLAGVVYLFVCLPGLGWVNSCQSIMEATPCDCKAHCFQGNGVVHVRLWRSWRPSDSEREAHSNVDYQPAACRARGFLHRLRKRSSHSGRCSERPAFCVCSMSMLGIVIKFNMRSGIFVLNRVEVVV